MNVPVSVVASGGGAGSTAAVLKPSKIPTQEGPRFHQGLWPLGSAGRRCPGCELRQLGSFKLLAFAKNATRVLGRFERLFVKICISQGFFLQGSPQLRHTVASEATSCKNPKL